MPSFLSLISTVRIPPGRQVAKTQILSWQFVVQLWTKAINNSTAAKVDWCDFTRGNVFSCCGCLQHTVVYLA